MSLKHRIHHQKARRETRIDAMVVNARRRYQALSGMVERGKW